MKKLAPLIVVLAVPPPGVTAQENPIPLEGLVVTASPTPRPERAIATHVTVLHGDDLRAIGVTRLDEALRGVPGLAVVRSGPVGAVTSLFMRGGESDYVLVMVDGVQVNRPGGSFDFSSLDLTNVERIEIVRGPASALYGSDAIAGVVNVITRVGAGPMRGDFSTRVGSYGQRDFTAGASGGAEGLGYSVAVSRESTDGILPFNNDFRHTVFSGAMRYRPDASTEADISVRIGDRTNHYPTDGTGRVSDRNAFSFGDETVVSARIRKAPSRSLSLEVLLGLSEADGGTDDALDGPADTDAFTSLDHVRRAEAGVRAHVSAAGVVFTVGGEVETERQRSFTESVSSFGTLNGRSESERQNTAAYVHASTERGRLALNAGARLEDNERFGRLGTWQLGLAWAPLPDADARLRASAASGIKEPTFFENYATGFAVGNPDLNPERTLSWEVGVDIGFADGAADVRATFFDQSFTDLIQFTFAPPALGDPNFFNVAAADSRGLELTASARVGRFSGEASWTRLVTNVRDSGFDQGPGATFVEGEPLLRRPKNSGSVHVTAELGPARTLSGGVRRVGLRTDRAFDPITFQAEPVDLGRYVTAWLGAALEIVPATPGRPSAAVSLRVDNLLDAQYAEVFGFPAPGRRLFVGATVGFASGG